MIVSPPEGKRIDGRYEWNSEFAPGDMVHVDGDRSCIYTVTAVQFRGIGAGVGTVIGVSTYELSCMAASGAQTAWVEEYRMMRV